MSLFMLFGYRLSVPLLLRIEPKSILNNPSPVGRRNDQTLESKCSDSCSEKKYSLPRFANTHNSAVTSLPCRTCCGGSDLSSLSEPAIRVHTGSAKSDIGSKVSVYDSFVTSQQLSSQVQSLLQTNYERSAISRRLNVSGKTNRSTGTSKSRQRGKATALLTKDMFVDMDGTAKDATRIKQSKRATSRKGSRDTLWTPRNEIYEASDSD